jgi:GAF domain-containing protein
VEALAVEAVRIQNLVGYDALAFFRHEDGMVRPKFVTGDDHRRLGSLCVPEGQGLVGWVAEVGKPILNGNPTVEPGFSQDAAGATGLASALALPLVNGCNIVGVLALYRNETDAFAGEELVSLLELCPRFAAVLLEMGDELAELTPAAELLHEKACVN